MKIYNSDSIIITCPICSRGLNIFPFSTLNANWCPCGKYCSYVNYKEINGKQVLSLNKDCIFIPHKNKGYSVGIKRFFDTGKGLFELPKMKPISFKLDLSVDPNNLNYIYSKLEKLQLLF